LIVDREELSEKRRPEAAFFIERAAPPHRAGTRSRSRPEALRGALPKSAKTEAIKTRPARGT
jgi:hypothetical protein